MEQFYRGRDTTQGVSGGTPYSVAPGLPQPTKPRPNIILRYAPIFASTLLRLFAVDGVAKSFFGSALRSANLRGTLQTDGERINARLRNITH
jgi:hypothetical protein